MELILCLNHILDHVSKHVTENINEILNTFIKYLVVSNNNQLKWQILTTMNLIATKI